MNMSFSDCIGSYIKSGIQYVRYFTLYKKAFKNYVKVISNVLSRRYPIDCILQEDNRLIRVYNYREIQREILKLSGLFMDINKDLIWFDFMGRRVMFQGGIKNGDIINIFFKDSYKELQVKGKVVVDIGANIADSSIYFVLSGATKVYAFEPIRESFEMAEKNIKLNGLEDKIHIYNAACGTELGSEGDTKVFALSDIIRDVLKSESHVDLVLKIDCEGCEYDIIDRTTQDVLRNFEFIHLEYHYGYANLRQKLMALGFAVKYTKPQYYRSVEPNLISAAVDSRGNVIQSSVVKNVRMYLGNLQAQRIGH